MCIESKAAAKTHSEIFVILLIVDRQAPDVRNRQAFLRAERGGGLLTLGAFHTSTTTTPDRARYPRGAFYKVKLKC